MIVDDDLPVPLKNINSNSKGNVSEKEKFKNYLNSLEKIIIDHNGNHSPYVKDITQKNFM